MAEQGGGALGLTAPERDGGEALDRPGDVGRVPRDLGVGEACGEALRREVDVAARLGDEAEDDPAEGRPGRHARVAEDVERLACARLGRVEIAVQAGDQRETGAGVAHHRRNRDGAAFFQDVAQTRRRHLRSRRPSA